MSQRRTTASPITAEMAIISIIIYYYMPGGITYFIILFTIR